MTKFVPLTYRAKSICMFSCTVVLKIDPIDSRPHQSFESKPRRWLAKNFNNRTSVEKLQIES